MLVLVIFLVVAYCVNTAPIIVSQNETLVVDSNHSKVCVRALCGNAQFSGSGFQPNRTLQVNEKPIIFLVYSIWVGEKYLDVNLLNHKIYCDFHGYEYKNYYYNGTSGIINAFNRGWANILTARDLLASSGADYFVKLDLDAVFVRMDVRLEQLVDANGKFSFFTTDIAHQYGRFLPSHAWIIKNTDFSKNFMNTWLSFRTQGGCGSINMEQGALLLTIAMKYRAYFINSTTPFTCNDYCNTGRKGLQHYLCGMAWLHDNQFGYNTSNTSPDIFIYNDRSQRDFVSPDDGYAINIVLGNNEPMKHILKPLIAHPCKTALFTHPLSVNVAECGTDYGR